MLSIISINGSRYVSLLEFYDYVFGEKKNYARWVRYYVTEQPTGMPVKGYDYLDFSAFQTHRKQEGVGHLRKDYLISIDFLKQLCFDIKTRRCRDIRNWANAL